MTLSSRGHNPQAPLSEYRRRLLNYFADPSASSAVINLSVAENRLVLPLLEQLLSKIPQVPVKRLTYDYFHGDESARATIAKFLTKHLGPVDKENVVLLNGAGSAIDLLGTMICEEDETCLVPAPGYAGYRRLLRGRAGVNCVFVATDDDEGEGLPHLTLGKLDDALERVPGRVNVVMIPSPDNPTGKVYSREFIKSLIQWARSRQIHLVFDEVYALSVHGDVEGISALSVLQEIGFGDDVHVVWSFSKDFGMSGLRMGVLVTQNEQMLNNIKNNLSYFSVVSRQSQWLVEQLVNMEKDVKSFLHENRTMLRIAYKKVTNVLDRIQIPYVPAQAGLFVWVDLREFVMSEVRELDIWEKLCEGGVMLTPGRECQGTHEGFFRLCFGAVDEQSLEEAMERLAMTVGQLRLTSEV